MNISNKTRGGILNNVYSSGLSNNEEVFDLAIFLLSFFIIMVHMTLNIKSKTIISVFVDAYSY